MPSSQNPSTALRPLLSAILLLSSSTTLQVAAHPYPLQNRDNDHADVNLRYLMPRQCVQRCGSDGQYCCDSGQVCFTSANIAGCSADSGDAYGIYTTTWTETNIFTSTVTTHWPKPTGEDHGDGGGGKGSGEQCVPKEDEGETACGEICCADFQYCKADGQCEMREGWSGGGITTTTDGNGQTITTRYSAPYRPTGASFTGSASDATDSAGATATAIGSDGGDDGDEDGNGDDDDDGGTGGGLSAGAIAGIVIGVLAGLALLGFICFCCVIRGLWGLCCGGRKKKERERVEVTEEHYRGGSRAPSAYTQRQSHRGWFGRPSSAGARRDEEKKSSGAGWLGLGAGAATMAALLGMKGRGDKDKEKDDPRRRSRSRYTDSYYSYTDSPSGSSAGGRSYRTRRTGDGRAESRYSRSRI